MIERSLIALLAASAVAAIAYFAWRDHQRSSDERVGLPDDGQMSEQWMQDCQHGLKEKLFEPNERAHRVIPFDRGHYRKTVGE